MSNNILADLQPQAVFKYFEQICAIPHGSGNVKQISDYLCEFARERNLWFKQDESYNVIIKKPASNSESKAAPVILQGHIDMVAVKTDDKVKDMEKEGLDLYIDDGFVKADRTTLGADDGIAVAYALAILDSRDISHPPIEAVFTVDEEIGMGGAHHLDTSVLKGKICLNIDSEIEGVMTVGCAGGYIYDTFIPIEWSEESGTKMTISLSNLQGGHSGAEIQKQLGNAHKIMGRVLYALAKDYDFNIVSTNGGNAANVIAQYNTTEIIADPAQAQAIADAVAELEQTISAEFAGQEPTLSLKAVSDGETTLKAFDADTTSHVMSPLMVLAYARHHGLQHRLFEFGHALHCL